MEVTNNTLDKHCRMIYFWKGQNTSLGKLANKELESIIKFIKKYPEGLMNGYNKIEYTKAVSYILNWRENVDSRVYASIEARILKRAEDKADLLTKVIFNALKQTNKHSCRVVELH